MLTVPLHSHPLPFLPLLSLHPPPPSPSLWLTHVTDFTKPSAHDRSCKERWANLHLPHSWTYQMFEINSGETFQQHSIRKNAQMCRKNHKQLNCMLLLRRFALSKPICKWSNHTGLPLLPTLYSCAPTCFTLRRLLVDASVIYLAVPLRAAVSSHVDSIGF